MDKFPHFIPFLLGTMQPPNGQRINVQRMVEAIIIAAVAGLVSSVIAVDRATAIMEVELKNLQAQIADVNNDLHRIYDDLYAPKVDVKR